MKSLFKAVVSVALLSVLAACGGGGGGDEGGSNKVVVLFGDSLTDNNGRFVTPTSHWTETIKAAMPSANFVPSAVGGETTAAALKRLPSVLAAHRPTHIVITTGANDFWRGCGNCPATTQANLEQMAAIARNAGVEVILGEMTFQRSGGAVAARYSSIYRAAAHNTGSRYTHMTAGVPADSVHYHPDMVHHRDAAQEHMKNAVLNVLY